MSNTIGSSLSAGMGQVGQMGLTGKRHDRTIGAGRQLLGGPQDAIGGKAEGADQSELRSTFDTFVGEVFFGQMMESMRKTVGQPAYFNGGRAEEAFTERLDQVLSEEITKASANSFTGPMFELFSMQRS